MRTQPFSNRFHRVFDKFQKNLNPDIATEDEIPVVTEFVTKEEFLEVTDLIPNQATSENQLADKNFVNSSIGTNTAHYIYKTNEQQEKLPFTSVAELEAYSGTVTPNDYAFVTGTDSEGNVYFDRYKATVDGSTVTWAKEYRLNNSSFTTVQWAAINSGITAGIVNALTHETWTFTLEDDTTVDKEVVLWEST